MLLPIDTAYYTLQISSYSSMFSSIVIMTGPASILSSLIEGDLTPLKILYTFTNTKTFTFRNIISGLQIKSLQGIVEILSQGFKLRAYRGLKKYYLRASN